jgi:heme-degrading monooxygenase HmoA
VFSLSFLFQPGAYDEEFHRLDGEIQAIADATPGYLGVESWMSDDGVRRNAVYYWDDLRHLKDFSRSAQHLRAKSEYARWYDGYQVVVAEITASYGDGRYPHVTATLPRTPHPAAD